MIFNKIHVVTTLIHTECAYPRHQAKSEKEILMSRLERRKLANFCFGSGQVTFVWMTVERTAE